MMMGRHMKRWALLGLLVALLAPEMAVAQRPQGGRNRPDMERQLRERFEAMVQRELGLGDEQAAVLREAVAEFQEDRGALAQRQRELQRRLRSTGSILSEDEARSVLDELVAVKQEEVRLLELEQARLLEVLSPQQLVRFYTLREQLGARIRQLRQNRPGNGRTGAGETAWGSRVLQG